LRSLPDIDAEVREIKVREIEAGADLLALEEEGYDGEEGQEDEEVR